jgi:colanic acid biosynthesis glycosyl transferase WcaI
MASQLGAMPFLPKPDVVVAVSPSFPALLPAMINCRIRRVPWVLWLQDILPDGAVSTGLLKPGPVLELANWFERAAYRGARRIVVVSDTFKENLRNKGVPSHKLDRIYNPATRTVVRRVGSDERLASPRVFSMGNIGYTQGLVELVRAFERSAEMAAAGVQFVIAGEGVAADAVRAEVKTERVQLLGVVSDDRLEAELQKAGVALVSQQYAGPEFNVPSKLMNFMAYGIPVIASVQRDSEVGRIITRSGGGWMVDSADPDQFPSKVSDALTRPEELERRGAAAHQYACEHFRPSICAERFEEVLLAATA